MAEQTAQLLYYCFLMAGTGKTGSHSGADCVHANDCRRKRNLKYDGGIIHTVTAFHYNYDIYIQ